MHPRQTWLAIGLLTACTVQAAVIYKWVDADGVVHYSDQSSPGAEKIVTAGSSSSATSGGGARSATGPTAQAPQRSAERAQLQRIFDHFAGAGADLFRRRRRGGALESQPLASARSIHHMAFERQAARFSADRRIVRFAAPGSRHLCPCRHHHRSANERITDQQQRDLLRASALGAVAAVAAAQIAATLRPPDAQLVG